MLEYEKIFPIRYEKSRPFIQKVMSLCKNKTQQEIFDSEFQLKVQHLIFDEMVKTEERFPSQLPVSEQSFNSKLTRELNFFWFYYKWQNSGRNIFHFTKELIELFENTDVDQIPLDIIQFPFKSFYISFRDLDRQFAIDTLGNAYFIDGIFIIKNFVKENQIDIFFNSYDKTSKISNNWLWENYASLIGDWYRINFTQENNTLRKAGFLPKFLKEYPDAGQEASIDFFMQMASTAINALCYLSSKQETPIQEFPKDIPQILLSKLKNAKTKHQKEIANADIKRQGFTKINFVGQAFKHSNGTNDLEKSVSTHWRRGFWRNQACGQGLKEHKLIWIKPTIVNAEKGEPTGGHIYKA